MGGGQRGIDGSKCSIWRHFQVARHQPSRISVLLKVIFQKIHSTDIQISYFKPLPSRSNRQPRLISATIYLVLKDYSKKSNARISVCLDQNVVNGRVDEIETYSFNNTTLSAQEQEVYTSNQPKTIQLSLKIALLKVGSINWQQENEAWLHWVQQSTLLGLPLSSWDQMN